MTEADALLSQAVRGDTDALSRLAGLQAPLLRRTLAGKIDRRYRALLDVEDVLQVTYIEVFLKFDRFVTGGADGFAAWVTRIAQNNLCDAVRELSRGKRPDPRRRVQPAGDDSYVALLELVGYASTTPSRHATRSENKQVLERALRKLPEDYAKAVRLYDLEGRSAAEAAAAMGRKVGAFHMLRCRAHDRLRDLLGPSRNFFSDGG